MNKERRKYPRIRLGGEANLLIGGVVRTGALLDVSPSGLQVECRSQLVDQLSRDKTEAGLFPDLDLEFVLPDGVPVQAACTVSYCRRLSQRTYHLGLNFANLTPDNESRLDKFINHSQAA